MLCYSGIRERENSSSESLYWQELEMAKKKKHKLLYPPRYPRNDPRNKLRMKVGAAIGRQMQGLDLPVRKVRYKTGSKAVTIPKEVWKAMGIEIGDELRFSITQKPGVIKVAVIKSLEVPAGRRHRCDMPTRKVRRQNDRVGCKMVTIPAEISEVLGIDFGDELLFSMTQKPGVMTITVIKRPGDPAGCRRGG